MFFHVSRLTYGSNLVFAFEYQYGYKGILQYCTLFRVRVRVRVFRLDDVSHKGAVLSDTAVYCLVLDIAESKLPKICVSIAIDSNRVAKQQRGCSLGCKSMTADQISPSPQVRLVRCLIDMFKKKEICPLGDAHSRPADVLDL